MKAALLQRRNALVAQMRTLLGDANDNLTAEQSEAFERMKADLTALDKRIEQQTYLDEIDRNAPAADTRFAQAAAQFSIRNAILCQVPGSNVDGGLERELSQEMTRTSGIAAQGIMMPTTAFHKRVVTTAAPGGGPGGNLIQETILGEQYIDLLREKLIVARLGGRYLSGLVGNVAIPKLSVSAAGSWVAENAAISATDPEHLQVELSPKHVGKRVEYSRNMLLQSTPDIEMLLRSDLAKVVAVAIDAGALVGGGSNEPTGILATVTPTAPAGALTWADVVNLVAVVEGNNVDVEASGCGFAMTAAVKAIARANPVGALGDAMIMPDPNRLAGYPAYSSESVSTGCLIFGYFPDLMVGQWGGVDILVNPYESTAYSKGNVQIRVMASVDVALRHAESFAAYDTVVS